MSKGHGIAVDSQSAELGSSEAIWGLLSCLAVISDPRKRRGKRHLLLDMLAIAVLGCLCGCDDAEALEDWADKERQWLSGLLELPHGTPGQDVFLRVLAALDPEQFRSAFLVWARQVLQALGVDDQLAVDGQTNRGSRDRFVRSGCQSDPHQARRTEPGRGTALGSQSGPSLSRRSLLGSSSTSSVRLRCAVSRDAAAGQLRQLERRTGCPWS